MSEADTRYLAAEQVRAILTRAAELDAADLTGLTPTELVRVAQEAGISPRAVEQALAEVGSAEVPVPAPHVEPERGRSVLSRFGTALKLGGVAAVMGAAGAAENSEAGLTLALLVVGGLTLYRALVHRRTGSTTGFQIEAVALTAGLTAGALVAANPFLFVDVLRVFPVLGVLAGLVGTAIVSVGRSQAVDASPASATVISDR